MDAKLPFCPHCKNHFAHARIKTENDGVGQTKTFEACPNCDKRLPANYQHTCVWYPQANTLAQGL